MRKLIPALLLLVLSMVVSPVFAQIVGENMIDDFESTRRLTWANSAGTLTQPVANPFPGVNNNSSHVATYVRNAGVQWDFVVAPTLNERLIQDIGSYQNGTKKFSMKVYTTAPVGTAIEITVEKKSVSNTGWPQGRHSNYRGTVGTSGAWHTVIFDFVWQPAPATNASELDQIVLAFDPGNFTNHTFHFDDIRGFAVQAPVIPQVPNTEHAWDNFRNIRRVRYSPVDGTLTTTSTPTTTGNASTTVGRYVRSTQQFDLFSANFDSTLLDLPAYRANTKKFSVKVYSPAVGTVIQFTLQDSLAALGGYPTGRFAEFRGTTSVANQWERVTLSWVGNPDAGVNAARVDQMAILVNPNTTTSVTVFLDSLYGPKFGPPPVAVIAGENAIHNFDDVIKLTFGNSDGTLVQPIANPSVGGNNTSANVGRYVRNPSVQYDALLANMIGVSTDIANYFNGTKRFTMKVWTNAPVGTRVEFALQNAARAATGYPNGRHSIYGTNTTVSRGWETLTFTYAFQPDAGQNINAIDQMTLSFRPNAFTADTFYFDEMKGFPIVSFVDPTPHREHRWTTNNVRYRQSARYTPQANPSQVGNSSSFVGRYVRSTSANDTLLMRFDSALTDLPAYRANTKKFSVKVYSASPNVNIHLVLQDSNATRISNTSGRYAEFSGVTSTTNQWETVVLTYRSTPDATITASSVNSAAFLVNRGTTSSVTVFLDSLYGPKFEPRVEDNSIIGQFDIENFETVRKLSFGNSGGVFTNNVANPAVGSGNPSATVGQYVRNGGVQYDYLVCTMNGQALDVPAYYLLNTKKFSMKLYTTAPVGTTVELTLENSALAAGGYPQGRHSVYAATVTAQNAWHTLVFNYVFQPSFGVLDEQIDQVTFSFNNNSFTNFTYYFDDFKGFDVCVPPTIPTISLNNAFNTLCSAGGSIVLTSSHTGDNLWSNGETTRSITVTSPGTYRVRAISATGCTSAVSAQSQIVQGVNATPTIIADGPTTFCAGAGVTLTSSTALGNIWSNGETTRSIFVTTPGTYTVQVIFGGCTSAVSSPTVTATQNCSQVFSGTGNYNNASLWLENAVPDNGTDILVNGAMTQNVNASFANISVGENASIVIPEGITLTVTGNFSNQGEVSGAGTLRIAGSSNQTFGGGTISNLTVANGRTVTQSNATMISGTLTVGNNTTLNLGNQMLTMLSTASGTARLAAVPTTGSVTNGSNFTIQRWLDRTNVRRTTTSNGNYYLLGPGVSGQTVGLWNGVSPYSTATFNNSTAGGGNFYFYSTSANNWIKPTGLNQSLPNGAGAQVWFGINGFFSGNRNVWSATGSPAVGTFNLPVVNQVGFQLVSNPYPSTIDWDSPSWTKTNVANAMYIYDWVNRRYRTYVNSIGVNGGSRYLATAQGFFVQTTNTTNFLVAIENVKVSNQVAMQRTESNVAGLIRMEMTNNGESDEMVIANRPEATTAYETAFDAHKLMNPATNIFVNGGVNQSVASMNLNEVNAIPFVIQTANSGIVTLRTTEFNNVAGYTFNLFNEQTGELLPYTGTETYTFNVSANQPYRLQLRVGSVTGINTFKASAFEVFPNPATDKVTIRTNGTGSLEVINVVGQVVMTQPATETNEINVSKLAKGVYTVKFNGASQKLVVK
jgi:hypothetical protein